MGGGAVRTDTPAAALAGGSSRLQATNSTLSKEASACTTPIAGVPAALNCSLLATRLVCFVLKFRTLF